MVEWLGMTALLLLLKYFVGIFYAKSVWLLAVFATASA